MSEDGLMPYPMPDAFTEDADGNIVPVRNILPRHTARGRFYENGPLSFCDRADIHPQPCTCAALPLRPLEGADEFAMETLGQVMASLLGATEQPGPPCVHTFVPPEPIGQDEDGNDIYPPPGPAWTLVQRPVADVVTEAGFGHVPERIEITADFCQCPACKGLRCEP